jgi:DNA-binding LacI/PurR family transcriptional regulator
MRSPLAQPPQPGREPPTAVIGLSDVLALGALEAMAARGLTAPADVSVCGFDDIPAAADAALTTLRQPIAEKGRKVGELLLDPDAPNRQILLPIQLVARATTGTADNSAARTSSSLTRRRK